MSVSRRRASPRRLQELHHFHSTAAVACSARTGTTATATGGGGDEAEAAGGPAGWPDPVPRTQGTPPPPPRLAFFFPISYPILARGTKARGSILLLPLDGVVGAGGAGAVPDGPSHRVADALHGQCRHLRPPSDSDAFSGFASGGKDAIFLFSGWFWDAIGAGFCL